MSRPVASPQPTLIGADGGRRGSWLVVTRTAGGRARLSQLASTAELFDAVRRLQPLAVVLGVPIGLPESGSRRCDLEARQLLRPRSACVFPAPPRQLLGAGSQSEASQIWRRLYGRGCPAQTYGILARIRAVDQELEGELVERAHEGHPELSFLQMAGGRGLPSKHSPEGMTRRIKLLASDFPEARAWTKARWSLRLDVLDACACRDRRRHRSIPHRPAERRHGGGFARSHRNQWLLSPATSRPSLQLPAIAGKWGQVTITSPPAALALRHTR